MKKIAILLAIFAILVSFISCDQFEYETKTKVFSINIVNESDIPLTINSVEAYVDTNYYIADYLGQIEVNYELSPGKSKKIDIPYDYEVLISETVSEPNPTCQVKLYCKYNNDEIPVVGKVYWEELMVDCLLLEKYFTVENSILQLDFGLYTDTSSEQVYAIVEHN